MGYLTVAEHDEGRHSRYCVGLCNVLLCLGVDFGECHEVRFGKCGGEFFVEGCYGLAWTTPVGVDYQELNQYRSNKQSLCDGR